VMLVFGSEGEGVTNFIKRLSHEIVYIPPMLDDSKMKVYPYDIIDSLNVGVCAGILVFHIKSQLLQTN